MAAARKLLAAGIRCGSSRRRGDMSIKRAVVQLLGAVASAMLLGCLSREESLDIQPDGSVTVRHTIRGDKGDIDGGAARLPGAPFKVERRTVQKDDGTTEELFTAKAGFARVADIPRGFAQPGDRFAERALRFTTTLEMRQEGGFTYYRFERRYTPRRWADYAAFLRRAFPKEIEELLGDLNRLARASMERKRQAVKAILLYEKLKLQHQAERATAALVKGRQPTDAQLAIRAAVHDYFTYRVSVDDLVELLWATEPKILKAANKITARAKEVVLEKATQELELDEAGRKQLEENLALEEHDLEVSQDLEDEGFTVRVRMPGAVIGHNGDEAVADEVTFRFNGQDLRDRDVVLVATSKRRR